MITTRTITLSLALLSLACGSGSRDEGGASNQTPEPSGDGLSAFQLENGIGPITSPVEVGPIDQSMADLGHQVFETKCSACHKMGEKYVGPALGDVTVRRTPAFIMNMILNPQEMVERHPVGKELLAQHMSFMPNQGLTQDEARQVVEYLRTRATSK